MRRLSLIHANVRRAPRTSESTGARRRRSAPLRRSRRRARAGGIDWHHYTRLDLTVADGMLVALVVIGQVVVIGAVVWLLVR